MKYLLILLISSFSCLPVLSQVNVNENADRIKALEIELEKAKRFRDQVIAKRWEDRREYVQQREEFNREFDQLRNELELEKLEEDRIREEAQALQRDVEELKADLEAAKVRFGILSQIPRDRTRELSSVLERGFPTEIAERQKQYNQVMKIADTHRDEPAKVLQEAIDLHLQEMQLTRGIELERQSLLFADHSEGKGWLLRVGTVISGYRAEDPPRSALLLKDPLSPENAYRWREDLVPEVAQKLNAAITTLKQDKTAQVTFPVDILGNKSVSRSYSLEEQKTAWERTKDYVMAGGIFMWPLLGIPLLAGALLAERVSAWRRRGGKGNKKYQQVLAFIKEDKEEEALKVCEQNREDSVLRAVETVLRQKGTSREGAEKRVQEYLLHEVPVLERRLGTIAVLGAAAPLLGLLGTVSGLIGMFDTITLHGTNDPKLLAGGISEALITTKTGLIIAIPIMLAHNFMANRMERLVGKVEEYSMKSLNIIWPTK